MVGEVRGDPLRNWVTGSVDPDTPAIYTNKHYVCQLERGRHYRKTKHGTGN